MLFVLCFFITSILAKDAIQDTQHSEYVLAERYEQLGDWSKALSLYLEAFQANPEKSEPLQKISSYYRHHGDNQLAYIFAKLGSILFSSYQFEEDLSIVSYYTGRKEDGYIAASNLMTRKDAPWWVKNQASKNILFYVDNLPNTQFQPISLDLPFVNDETEEQYHPMNPSILKTEDGYRVICRTVNYTQTGAKIFQTNDPEGIYRTRNFLLTYDRFFNLLSQEEIDECLERKKSHPISLVQGLEDARIFQFQNEDWFTCTTRDGNVSGVPQIVLCKIGEMGEVVQFIPLKGPDVNRCEKNWLPFIKNNEIQIIYSSDPFVVLRPDLETGDCKKAFEYEPTSDFSAFRGSASPIVFEDGYLMMVHEVSFLKDGSRAYLHRFVLLDENLQIQKVSKPFTFTHIGIEFCCGMTLNHEEDQIIMTIGIEDNQAMLVFLAKEEFKNFVN
ncbi:MAG TPA: hypothetical protein VLE96_00860 [Chlamydiales bacterium]|nr:hypothetical protein [Chlamydiales bacterium]